jgi:hypothetical protein
VPVFAMPDSSRGIIPLSIRRELLGDERFLGLRTPPETVAGVLHREQDQVVRDARNGRQTRELLLIHLSYAINRFTGFMGQIIDRVVVERFLFSGEGVYICDP